MKNVTDYYNMTATGWSNEFLKDKKESEILQKFYDCFGDVGTSHPRILDLGCGNGYDAKILSNAGAKVVGIDLSEKSVEIAKANVKESKFFVGDIRDKFTKLGKFEGVTCLATIVHINAKDMRQTFKNIAEVLKKGGLFLLSASDGVGRNVKKSLVDINGETYDKDYNNYNSTELCAFAYPELKLVDTWKFADFEEGWRYYIFQKQ